MLLAPRIDRLTAPHDEAEGGDDDRRTTDPAIDALSFDDALAELQRTVAELEAGGQPLEAAIALYERGVALQARCEKLLGDAELRVQQLRRARRRRARDARRPSRGRDRGACGRASRGRLRSAQPGAMFRLNRNRFSGS